MGRTRLCFTALLALILTTAAFAAEPDAEAAAGAQGEPKPDAKAEPKPRKNNGGASVSGDSLLQGLSFTKSKDPVTITADALEFDYRARVLVYRGKVIAEQGDMKLQSDALTLTLEKKSGSRLESVVAEGNVRLVKGERIATAGRAEFDQTERTVILRDHAVVQSGPNRVTGAKITVFLDDERTLVDGGDSRVQAVIYPQQSPAPANSPTSTPGQP